MSMLIENVEIVVSGRLRRIARVKAEYYEYVADPDAFVAELRARMVPVDLFTFLQETNNRSPRFKLHLEWESIAVLTISSYESWWKKQLNDKTRNMIRKATKAGVEVRLVEFDDDLVAGIVDIYNEAPVRQGKPFAHFGKSFEEIKRDHASFLDRSSFIGAFHGGSLIGFAKLVHGNGVSNLMQIISKTAHRDKAPTNALIAKAVEICAERKIEYLHYGLWSKRGLGDFKKHHRFERFDVPRYLVPLNLKGRLILALRLHRKLSDYVPDRWHDFLVSLRSRWNYYRYGAQKR